MGDAAALFGPALWVGLAIAAPVGPIGLLVIQRTLQQGRAVGLATGLGAAVADAAYGALGAFGVQGAVAALQALRQPLALGGASVLLWLAWRTWGAAPAAAPASAGPPDDGSRATAARLAGAFAGTFVLTLSNPATIFSFVAVFGALAARSGSAGLAAAPWLVAGVFTGSALWWLLLCGAVGALRQRFDLRWRRRVNRASALARAGRIDCAA